MASASLGMKWISQPHGTLLRCLVPQSPPRGVTFMAWLPVLPLLPSASSSLKKEDSEAALSAALGGVCGTMLVTMKPSKWVSSVCGQKGA
eukprot:6059894-Amphidinium_carterae.1